MGNVKILTIDDDDLMRESICGYLDDHGFETLEAANGRVGMGPAAATRCPIRHQ
jgi:DNA-binding response OmpR family regulator